MTQDPYGRPPDGGDDSRRPPEPPPAPSPGPDQQAGWGQIPGYSPPPAGYPPGYGAPYPQPKQDDRALWALILALLGWIMCPVVAHIVALVLANQSLRAIRESNGWLTGEGMANAARIISIVALAFFAFGIVLAIIAVAALVVV
jgi:hypothetical protein